MESLQEYTKNGKAIIASCDCVRKPITVTGEKLAAGTILGRITVGRKFRGYDADGTDDGRRTAVCVLLEDVDATSADVETIGGFAGCYVKDNVTGLDTAGEDALEARAIYFV